MNLPDFIVSTCKFGKEMFWGPRFQQIRHSRVTQTPKVGHVDGEPALGCGFLGRGYAPGSTHRNHSNIGRRKPQLPLNNPCCILINSQQRKHGTQLQCCERLSRQ
jgi:hypothetical protein